MPDHPNSLPGAAWLRWSLAGVLLALPIACASGGHGDAILAPTITQAPASTTVLKGANARFSVTTAGSGPMTFQWLRDGAAIPSATGASYATPATTLADSGARFSVKITNRAGDITSEAATLTVEAAPVILAQPLSRTVLFGTPVTFTVAVEASAPIAYQWFRGGEPVAGATGSSYTLASPQVATDNGAEFTVTVTNPRGSVTSQPAKLKVVPAIIPLAISAQPASQSLLDGVSALLSVTADGTGTLAYQWTKNGADLPGATGPSLAFDPVAPGDAGTYAVRISDDFGSITSADAVLAVQPSARINLAACPGFEPDNSVWGRYSTWRTSSNVLSVPIGSTASRAHGGSYYSNQGNYSVNTYSPATTLPWRDAVYQTVAVPSGLGKATLTLWLNAFNATGTAAPSATDPVNTFRILIKDADQPWAWGTAGALATVTTFSNLDLTSTSGYVQKTYALDLQPYRGRNILISVETEQTTLGASYFRTDDWVLEAIVPAP